MAGNNTKLLILTAFLTILVGIFLLWFGLQPAENVSPTPTPAIFATAFPKIQSQIATQSAVAGLAGESAQVTKVVDGDTIDVLINNQPFTVRLIGMDTPETVDPRRPVGCFGKEASNETKSLLTGKSVILQKDVSETDKYNRILRYVYLPLEDGTYLFINDFLVREGFAKVYTYPPDVKYDQRFKEAEKEARENNRGLWAGCK